MHEIMNRKFYLGPKFGTLFNKKWITISELLHLFIDGQVLIVGVVELDIRLVAHINFGSYRGEVETHRKRKRTFKHGIDAQTIMMI
jgi:hypothetical protein